MTTWEELLEGYVGLADKFICSTCLNFIFRGSSGHWGQKLILKHKLAAPGGLKDDEGHAVTFQCPDCAGREPIVAPIVHPNGQDVNHFNISELKDSGEEPEVARTQGDYENLEGLQSIHDQASTSQKILPPEQKKELEEAKKSSTAGFAPVEQAKVEEDVQVFAKPPEAKKDEQEEESKQEE